MVGILMGNHNCDKCSTSLDYAIQYREKKYCVGCYTKEMLKQMRKGLIEKSKVEEAFFPLIKQLEKHIGKEGTITITKPMCAIIISRLKELVK